MDSTASPTQPANTRFWALFMGSLGVVYGDIGTSPLYAFKTALLQGAADKPIDILDILGVLSLIFWSLTAVVTIKYVFFLLYADNKGEGGVLSLMALAKDKVGRGAFFVFWLGLIGTALFFGDAVITPAISVLSAVEGLELVQPGFQPYVVIISLAILIALFISQSKGTHRVSILFGPITFVWFLTLGGIGLYNIAQHPEVLEALNPYYAVAYLIDHRWTSIAVLGAVVLAVTGAEALYADLGHFGRKPIQAAWVAIVLPALVFNYFGQGAAVLGTPEKIENPLFMMVPEWGLLPLVLLATLATIIASQAVITGAFSLARQAIQLGLLPRMEIRHTSESQSGQIYMPAINRLLMISVMLLVMFFGSSEKLASAYGIAVTGTMIVSSLMGLIVVLRVWQWPLHKALLLLLPILAIDLIFFTTSLAKVHDGGWMPLLLALALCIVMATWVKGTRLLRERAASDSLPTRSLVKVLEREKHAQAPGTAVFLTADAEIAPTALLVNLRHNGVLHEQNLVMSLQTVGTPRVDDADRITIEKISTLMTIVKINFGYMEIPSVPKAMGLCHQHGMKFEISHTSFFISRRILRTSKHSGMPKWQDNLFITIANSAAGASDFFQIPAKNAVEIGVPVAV